jgi:hypothetical protein
MRPQRFHCRDLLSQRDLPRFGLDRLEDLWVIPEVLRVLGRAAGSAAAQRHIPTVLIIE